LGLLFWAETASAFYNPQTGRWLSRDPIGESGFLVLSKNTIATTVSSSQGNTHSSLNSYLFNDNIGFNGWDRLGMDGPFGPIPPVEPPSTDPYGPPSVIVATATWLNCNACPEAAQAVARIKEVFAKGGKCSQWFKDHLSFPGQEYVVMCKSKCNPMTWFTDSWTQPGIGIYLDRGACKEWGAAGLSSLIVHELAHHYCPAIIGRESCADSAQEACHDELGNL